MMRAAGIPAPQRARTRGFTLIEMLVVLMIMVLLVSVMVMTRPARLGWANRATVVQAIKSKLEGARRQAIASGRTVSLDLSAGGQKNISFRPLIGDAKAPTFFPDGSSNGGSILLDDKLALSVNWLTGQASDDHA